MMPRLVTFLFCAPACAGPEGKAVQVRFLLQNVAKMGDASFLAASATKVSPPKPPQLVVLPTESANPVRLSRKFITFA